MCNSGSIDKAMTMFNIVFFAKRPPPVMSCSLIGNAEFGSLNGVSRCRDETPNNSKEGKKSVMARKILSLIILGSK